MKNKTLKAAALAYNRQIDTPPKILASGVGEVAKNIIAKAKEFDVPLFANPVLADSLTNITIDDCIPEELYHGITEIFIWLENTQQVCQLSKEE
ncbi:EscU/YscU/HrcU family type III secretion system export apparatus switch protein [Helicobacter sp. 11S03491-1]|uniref:EscU/YscU/HrcU family type III secretion system export apparatus switch protein n=1 Tax=Helicobacter sp. 11S03491-1 TaxID=1476196 RepID=UPI000BA758E4|nr:EscU/YscU/HrcU family type III secretion system export apparatus switch protein [Helicobacter sp. 11S03491-1]PAF41982.1 flagellar biosynthesis protein FlhB [Helicobacter sp. 11S03491-1]